MRFENSQLNARVEELQNNVTERNGCIAELEQWIIELKTDIARLSEQNSSLVDTNASLSLQVESLMSQPSLQPLSQNIAQQTPEQLKPSIGAIPD